MTWRAISARSYTKEAVQLLVHANLVTRDRQISKHGNHVSCHDVFGLVDTGHVRQLVDAVWKQGGGY